MFNKRILFFFFFVAIFSSALFAFQPAVAATVSDFAAQASATVQTVPPTISLAWPSDPSATGYTVYRKLRDDTSWGTSTALPATASSYIDTNVTAGSAYEYRISKPFSYYIGAGYIYAGIQVPLVEDRGKIILIVDETMSASLNTELSRLEQDLIGDGWSVIRHDVPRMAVDPANTSSSVWAARSNELAAVKALITADYNADPNNVKAVFLFGHLPIPYSGYMAPDGHGNHYGAWPADVYYGDMHGAWIDSSVNATSASDPRNRNVPGDGKFDSSVLPGSVQLQVGRVDLANLPAFSQNETELLRQYLNKDHNFRHGLIAAQRRGLIDDHFGLSTGEPFAANGWRNFAPFFGAANITAADWLTTLGTQSYLWGYGCGAGTYTSVSGITTTAQLAASDPRVVFTMFFGSYFGDWDSQNNVMRAALATPTYTLTSVWAGRPNWIFHHMALGETIGFSTLISQTNKDVYASGIEDRGIHIALMGDPTLRMHVVAPVSGLTASRQGQAVTLSWTASPDTVVGYHVYRSANSSGPFSRLTNSPLASVQYTDNTASGGDYTYMIRAIKLEVSASGSYYNPSQGVFLATSGPQPPADTTPPVITNVQATGIAGTEATISWTTDEASDTQVEYGLTVSYGSQTAISSNLITAHIQTLSGLMAGATYHYRVKSKDAADNFANSNDTTFVTNPIQFTLTVTKSGTGSGTVTGTGIACGSDCSEAVNSGAAITITAVPTSGSTFTGWSGACSGAGSCAVTVSADTVVTAAFSATPVNGSCGATLNSCAAGSLSNTADSATQYLWSCAGSSGGSTASCSLPIIYTLSVAKGGTGVGTILGGVINCGSTCSATQNAGTSLTLTATANAGSTFTGWSGGGCLGTGSCGITFDAAKTVTGTFALAPVTGFCGAAVKNYTPTETFPSGAYCSSGTVSPAAPANPTSSVSSSWSCTGANGGSTASCTATRSVALINGSCGGVLNSCIAGTLSDTADSATRYLWQCTGANGGSTAACSLAKPAGDASPASSGGSPATGSTGSSPASSRQDDSSVTPVSGSCGATRDTCLSGIFSDIADSAISYLWKCLGSPSTGLGQVSGGSIASCSLAISSSSSTPALVLTTDIEMGTSTSAIISFPITNNAMYERLKGKIILRVQSHGEAYYLSPKEKKIYYLGRPADAFQVMRNQGLGITNINLGKIPVSLNILSGVDTDSDGLPDVFEEAIGTVKDKADTDADGFNDKDEIAADYSPLAKNKKLSFDNALALKFKGRILLQVESHGEAWYMNPTDSKRYFLSRPADAFSLMRQLGLGVTNKDYQAMGGK